MTENGGTLRNGEIDFESNWCPEPPVGSEYLTAGADFDTVVLAISMGAYKPFGTEKGFCAELIAQGGPFADFVDEIAIVPSLGVQLWSPRTLAELGGDPASPPIVSGPEPLDIWADMTQILAVEPSGPVTLHYLCGPYPTTLYQQPSSATDTPARAAAEIARSPLAGSIPARTASGRRRTIA